MVQSSLKKMKDQEIVATVGNRSDTADAIGNDNEEPVLQTMSEEQDASIKEETRRESEEANLEDSEPLELAVQEKPLTESKSCCSHMKTWA